MSDELRLDDPSPLYIHQCTLGALIEIEDIFQGIRGEPVAQAVRVQRAIEERG